MQKVRRLHAEVVEDEVQARVDSIDISLGGENPSPVDHLIASLAGCVGLTMKRILARQRVEAGSLCVDVAMAYSTEPYTIDGFEVTIRVHAHDLSPNMLERALSLTEKYCPVQNVISRDIEMKMTAERV